MVRSATQDISQEIHAASVMGRVTKSRRILAVDDHPVVRHGLRQMIQELGGSFTVCADLEPGAAVCRAVDEWRPDLVISEISFCSADGIGFVRHLRQHYPRLPILILSALDEQVYAERMLNAGANGYIMKQAPVTELIVAIRSVSEGQIYVAPGVGARILERAADARPAGLLNPIDRLSNRELQVLQMIGKGMSTRSIAGVLCLSIKTIESHRQRIKGKLNLRSGVQLVQFSMLESSRRAQASASA